MHKPLKIGLKRIISQRPPIIANALNVFEALNMSSGPTP
jgi:hypothetical protein